MKISFQNLAENLTKRPGNQYKHWKKLYKIYIDFLELCADTGTSSYDSIPNLSYQCLSLIDRTQHVLNHHGVTLIVQPSSLYLLFLMMESFISLPLKIYISGIRTCQIDLKPELLYSYTEKLTDINKLSKEIFPLFLQFPDNNFILEIRVMFKTIIWISDICGHNHDFKNIDIYSIAYTPFPYTKARYIQLSLFKTKCIILNQLCNQKYPSTPNCTDSCISYLLKDITESYHKLGHVPLLILEDYYYALTNYTFYTKPSDIGRLIDYIFEDLKRYEHIWNHSSIIVKVHAVLLKLQPYKNYNLENSNFRKP